MNDVVFSEQEFALISACVADSEMRTHEAFKGVDLPRLFVKLNEAKKQAAALTAAHARYLQVLNARDAAPEPLSFEL